MGEKRNPESAQGIAAEAIGKKKYVSPKLTRYGAVQALTRAGTASKNEGNPGQKRVSGSDRRMKESVVRVGPHPFGMDLYLFEYKPEFREMQGAGLHLGVMADEVARLFPEAVTRDASGYDLVDYGRIGPKRNG